MKNNLRLVHSDYVMPVSRSPIHDGCIVLDGSGRIIDIGEFEEIRPKYGNIRPLYFRGCLLPGFVNSHTHLELSALKDCIKPSGRGLPDWLKEFNNVITDTDIRGSISLIESQVKKLKNSGTVAVGDISNTGCTPEILGRNKMMGTVFVEYFDILGAVECKIRKPPRNTGEIGLSLSPHALYSTSKHVVNSIIKLNRSASRKTSIHFCEDMSEIRFIKDRSGQMEEFLASKWPSVRKFYDNVLDTEDFVEIVSEDFILVHCVCVSKKTLRNLKRKNPSIIVCPRSNVFISGVLPPLYDIKNSGINVALGTDSLASCYDLDIRNEIAAVRNNFKKLWPDFILRMATINGATALGISHKAGSLEIGKRPGIINISFDESPDDAERFVIDNIEKLPVRRIA